MPRTTKRGKTVIPNKSKQVSVGIQCNIDNDAITYLQEQLKVLQLENETLKKQSDGDNVALKNSSQNANLVVRSLRQKTNPIETESQIVDKRLSQQKTCSCKGNCSTKVCGCVKHQRRCDPKCKCKNLSCKNQKLENKENEESFKNEILDNIQELENTSSKSEAVSQNLFSPTNKRDEVKLGNITFEEISFDTKKILIYSSDEDTKKKIFKKDTIEKKNKTKQENEDKNDLPEVDTSFDPMKPKRQLPRTPPRVTVENESCNISTIVETPTEKIENILPKEDIPEELNQENVDLDELNIELVRCNKCKRKFYPWRVEVHQSACHQL